MKKDRGRGLAYPLILTPLVLLLLAGCALAPVKMESEANIVWPKPPDKPKIRFLKTVSMTSDFKRGYEGWLYKIWKGLAGEGVDKVLVSPYGVSVADDGYVYVTDRDTREIFSFNPETGKSRFFFYETGDQEDYPIGIGIAENIYVSYPNSGRVIVFDKKGNLIKEISEGDGLKRPTGVAVNRDKGLLYVVDTLSHDIKVFDFSGTLLFTFGSRGNKDGELNYPTHIFAGKDGTVYITDELNFRVQTFAHDGRFLFKFGKIGTVPGTLESPKGVAVDSEGNIYLVEAMADTIQVFDNKGKLLLLFGGSGSDKGRFEGPAGIFIDGKDRIYVTDLYNSRVQVFQYLKGD